MAPEDDILGVPDFLRRQATEGEGAVSLDDARRQRDSENAQADPEYHRGSSLGAAAAPDFTKMQQGQASGVIVGRGYDPLDSMGPITGPAIIQKVLGLRTLTTAELELLVESRALGDIVGRHISKLESRLDLDKRWLAIAKTDLQKGFDALKRAIARPEGF